ncbi:regulatory GntR family protein [Flavobacterium sp. 1]|uniref:GntR family transcriptional regulator n=1 Tax=Flavobacterium sp. 1 TaxID=2035200 RepID=UPI000CC17729|nr:winged helix-turn-helix domain-containing protein [Flavobacterium sp. 1]PJJ08416.1 regulatory GntR family protein [Flavobacterium sp. 1]
MENFVKIKDIISISDYSRVRKHKQIVDSVMSATRMGALSFNDKLPSVNELAFDHNVSRDTVVRAYAFLKENNVIESIPGKGYYLKLACNDLKLKVFLLFNKLSPCQKKIFDALTSILNEFAIIDFYVYQNDYAQFKKLILNSKSKDYTHYILNTHFDDRDQDVVEFIKSDIPLEKLIMLDKKMDKLGEVACVYQDFESDIISALIELNPLLKKYKAIKLVFPEKSHLPQGIKTGFFKFCNEFKYDWSIVEDAVNEKLEKRTVYINVEENDLIHLIKQIKSNDFVIGEDIGIISYNDSSLKEVLLDGITVISSDFDQLGKQAAHMVLKNGKEQIRNGFGVFVRNSL